MGWLELFALVAHSRNQMIILLKKADSWSWKVNLEELSDCKSLKFLTFNVYCLCSNFGLEVAKRDLSLNWAGIGPSEMAQLKATSSDLVVYLVICFKLNLKFKSIFGWCRHEVCFEKPLCFAYLGFVSGPSLALEASGSIVSFGLFLEPNSFLKGCLLFLDSMQAWNLPEAVNFKYNASCKFVQSNFR